jgi:hypothetical protein
MASFPKLYSTRSIAPLEDAEINSFAKLFFRDWRQIRLISPFRVNFRLILFGCFRSRDYNGGNGPQ